MGIFDKKAKGRKSEDFDSPIETIDLRAASAGTPANTSDTGASETPAPVPTAPEQATPEATIPAPAEEKPRMIDQDYGIEEAIALMRTLPADSIELVVRVVKQTLESTHIDIPTIIVDATAKQERITNRIGVLKEAIKGLEEEIAARSTEISSLEADHQETSMVKERLELAEKLGERNKSAPQSKLPAPPRKPADLGSTLKK